jgi:hypothetical protein
LGIDITSIIINGTKNIIPGYAKLNKKRLPSKKFPTLLYKIYAGPIIIARYSKRYKISKNIFTLYLTCSIEEYS